MLVHLVLAIGAALRLPVAPGAIVRVARVGALTMAEADEKKWTQSEDWALADAVPQFTVGQSSSVSTFWTALATTTPELGSRSATECERRFAKLDAEEPAGKQPPVLEDWSKLDDGRYTGRLAGQSSFVWLTVALEGRLASDPRTDEPGYVEAIGGQIYELSRAVPAAKATAVVPPSVAWSSAPAPPSASPSAGGLPPLLQQAVAVLGAGLVAGGVGFGLGSAVAPPPPPPPPLPAARVTRVIVTSDGRMRSTREGDAIGGAPRAAPSQLAPAPLTLGEQRERAELRVDRDKMKIANLEQRLREDEQRVGELRRVEQERGGTSEAVKLLFPKE